MKKTIPLSIIIPSYNEGKTLPMLLKSIIYQSVQPREIIVADNNSTDDTCKIAKKYKCIVTKGGSPAVGRNNGAKIASSNILMFIDADTLLCDKHFLAKSYSKFIYNNVDFATTYYHNSKTTLKGHIILFFINAKKWINSLMFKLLGRILSLSGGIIFIKRSVFLEIKGFDTSLDTFEDRDLGLRLTKKHYSYTTLPTSITISMRRYEQRSVYELALLATTVFLYRRASALHSPSAIKYKDNYDDIKGSLGGKE